MNQKLIERIKTLSPEQRRVFEKKLERQGINLLEKFILPQGRETNRFPLSFAQQRLWFLDQLEPNSTAYHMPITVRLQGDLNVELLQQALDTLVARHETLRTVFQVEGDADPEQVIMPAFPFPLVCTNLSHLPHDHAEKEAKKTIADNIRQTFCLENGPLIRGSLFKLSNNEHILFLIMHHIVSDGWSINVLIQEMTMLYDALVSGDRSPLAPLPIQYADFAVWQQAWLQGDVLEKQFDYWKTHLTGAPAMLDMPTDYPRPPIQTFNGSEIRLDLPASLPDKLRQIGLKHEATLFMTMLAAFQILLFRYSGQDDLVVGTPNANRQRPEIQGLIGFFVNTLALRTDLSGNPTFIELLGRVRGVTLGSQAHQDLPFERLLNDLQIERDMSRPPLFQTMFSWLNRDTGRSLEVGGMKLSPIRADMSVAKFDLTLEIAESRQGLDIRLEYNTDLFKPETLARFLEHYQILLGSIVANPDQRIADLPIMSSAEREQLLVTWNDTGEAFAEDMGLHDLFAVSAKSHPKRTAVVFGDVEVSYGELDKRANQLAHHLQTLGVGPETFVGICMRRTPDMLVGMLATLKAGGAYVPVDPAYPQERQAFMLADTGATVVLTQADVVAKMPAFSHHIVQVDTENIDHYPPTPPDTAVTTAHLAYTIYTSGSTGKPKGVAITHRNAAAMCHWASKFYPPDVLQGVLAATSISFDLSVYEIFFTFSQGGTLILADNAMALPALPAKNSVTLINTVPSAMTELTENGALPDSIRVVNLAGEPLKHALVQKIYANKQVEQVWNLYGPSEDTTYSTYALIDRTDNSEPTIGLPLTNTQAYVLDKFWNPVPLGVVGELYLGGDGVTRGYLHRPDLTAERYIPDPFAKTAGGRLYFTGDVVRYLPDGRLEYLGRSDHQVKIRGFRIELSEIESVLLAHEAVRETVVVAIESTAADGNGEKQLAAYVVGVDPTNAPTLATMRVYIGEKLPDYMMPAFFIFLDAMPLTPNGKIDRKKLPTPSMSREALGNEFVAPSSELEIELAAMWADLLNVDQVGVNDNFFALGGHSILATRLVARIRQHYAVNLPLHKLFEATTVARLAEVLLEEMYAADDGTDDLEALLAEIEAISDEDVADFLSESEGDLQSALPL